MRLIVISQGGTPSGTEGPTPEPEGGKQRTDVQTKGERRNNNPTCHSNPEGGGRKPRPRGISEGCDSDFTDLRLLAKFLKEEQPALELKLVSTVFGSNMLADRSLSHNPSETCYPW